MSIAEKYQRDNKTGHSRFESSKYLLEPSFEWIFAFRKIQRFERKSFLRPKCVNSLICFAKIISSAAICEFVEHLKIASKWYSKLLGVIFLFFVLNNWFWETYRHFKSICFSLPQWKNKSWGATNSRNLHSIEYWFCQR